MTAQPYKPNFKGDEEPKLKLPEYMILIKEGHYEVNLCKLEGTGKFPCPVCGSVISPDDETEDTYSIVDTKTKNFDLEEITLECNKCKSIHKNTRIKIKGFIE